jgi:hypothetical protein
LIPLATTEDRAIAAINAAEQMAIANVQLIREMKSLIPKPFDGLVEGAIRTNTAGIGAVATAERKVVRKASKYNRKFAKAYKKIKKAKPRSKHASIMKQAHKMAKRMK